MGQLTGPTEQCVSLLFLENRKEMVGSWPRLQRVGRGMGKLFWGRCKSGAVGRGIAAVQPDGHCSDALHAFQRGDRNFGRRPRESAKIEWFDAPPPESGSAVGQSHALTRSRVLAQTDTGVRFPTFFRKPLQNVVSFVQFSRRPLSPFPRGIPRGSRLQISRPRETCECLVPNEPCPV